MTGNKEIEKLIQLHKTLEPFDYKLAVDWAIDLIRNGNESDNILMLASFSEPFDKYDIGPYIAAVLNELHLKEYGCDDTLIAQSHYFLSNILSAVKVRENLKSLAEVCINHDFDTRTMNFYLIYHGWSELEEIGDNYYYEGANLDNIEKILKMEAHIWIDRHVFGKENIEVQNALKTELSPHKKN